MRRRTKEPKMAEPTPDPPEDMRSLLERDYTYLERLDAETWLIELTRLYNQSVDYGLQLHEVDPHTSTFGETEGANKAVDVMTVQAAVPTVEFVEKRNEGFLLPSERLPALIVTVNAPDEVIIEEVTRALKELSKSFGAPVKNPGPYLPNNSFSENIFKKWRTNKIVQFADLLAINASRKMNGQPHFKEYVLGVWLWGVDSSPGHTSDAKATLKRAIASRQALLAQITNETPSPINFELVTHLLVRSMTRGRDAQGQPTILLPKKLTVTAVKPIKRGD